MGRDSICSPATQTTPFIQPSLPPSKAKSSSLSSSPVEMSRPFPAIPYNVDPYPGDDPVFEIPIEDWPWHSDDDEPAPPAAPPEVNAWNAAPGRMSTPFAHAFVLLTSSYFHRLNGGSDRRVECPCPRQSRHGL